MMRGGLPGDPPLRQRVARAVRVDHAGEFGAKRIYEGQLAILGKAKSAPSIRTMAAEETEHLRYFERALVERRIRPSFLHPLWRIAGFALGAGSALLGEKAAMACTVAVEEVVVEHYRRQHEELAAADPELAGAIARFGSDEENHRTAGQAHGAAQAPAYPLMSLMIRSGTRCAIWLAGRL